MTTTDAAAARRHRLSVARAVVIGFAGLSLAGCGSSLFEAANNTTPEPATAPKAAVESVAKVALNSIVGPPDALGKQLHQEFASALGTQRVTVTSSKEEGADYHLRPYILAAKEKNGTKVSYVLDISDATGKRVNRFTGEEMVPGNPSRDPWAAITPPVAQSITAKATGSFVAWLPSARAAIASAPAAAPPAAAPAGVGGQKDDTPPAATAKAARPAAKANVAAAPPPASDQTTGSINRESGPVTALVPTVSGAPGDGSKSLTAAIQRELQSKGVTLADRASTTAYRVEGAVTLGEAREGKQAIQIEWVVKDPQGKRLGTVAQKNDIPEGSLDGAWGRTAEQAAGAAVQGIAKLLPTNRAVN